MTKDVPASFAVDSADRYNVPALERGLRLLCEFNRETPTLSAPELARRFALPRSTVFRLLSTLEGMGFIERTEGGRDYRLGLAVLRLGFEYLASLELTELGLPVLNRLCDDLRQPCVIVVRDHRSIVYVARVSPPTLFRNSVPLGTRLPAHATALGRVLLEDLTLPQLRALYPEEQLEAFSAETPRTATGLFDMVQAGRERGYVLGEGVYEPDISTIAAPVRDHGGRIVAALGAIFTAARLDGEPVEQLVQRVRSAANEISGLLNYAGPSPVDNVVPLHGAEPTR